MIVRTRQLFERLSTPIDPERLVSTLSVAEKQMTEIAKALLEEANLLILDEPTTVLSKQETNILFCILRELRYKGASMIFVSHKLPEMLSLCDEVAVLRDGVLISRDTSCELTPMDIARRMVGRNLSQAFPPKIIVPDDAPERLRVKNLSSADGMVRHVSFAIRQGEILGLAGLAGAGRTELAETICNLRKRARRCRILLNGKEVRGRTPRAVFDAGISYLSEDRQGTALLTGKSVTENTTLSSLLNYCSFGFIRKQPERQTAENYIERFRIKCDSAQSLISSLSGGNQQKVAIAKGLDTKPEVFIFDEPTRGVDVGARREIYDFIHELAGQGVSCLLISSDLEELIGNCTRVLVMHEGCLQGEVTGDNINEEEIICYATGIKGDRS